MTYSRYLESGGSVAIMILHSFKSFYKLVYTNLIALPSSTNYVRNTFSFFIQGGAMLGSSSIENGTDRA